MRETEHPGYELHRGVHVKLLNELHAFIAKLVENLEFPEHLLGFLNQWLINHIAKYDQQIARHVRGASAQLLAELACVEYLLNTQPESA